MGEGGQEVRRAYHDVGGQRDHAVVDEHEEPEADAYEA